MSAGRSNIRSRRKRGNARVKVLLRRARDNRRLDRVMDRSLRDSWTAPDTIENDRSALSRALTIGAVQG